MKQQTLALTLALATIAALLATPALGTSLQDQAAAEFDRAQACRLKHELLELRADSAKLASISTARFVLGIVLGRSWLLAREELDMYEVHQLATAIMLERHYGLDFKSTMEMLTPNQCIVCREVKIQYFEHYASKCS
jgi:hypothetical protein